MGENLVEGRVDEPHELDLRHRPQAVGCHADGGSDDGRFRNRGIDHPLRAEPLQKPLGDPEHAAVLPHVLAEKDHVLITLHLLAESEVNCLNHVQLRHWIIRSCILITAIQRGLTRINTD
jgi:hypothetical protein